MTRLRCFMNFQAFAFSSLVFGAEHVNGALRTAIVDGLKPTPCKEVLQAAMRLKLDGHDDIANKLLDSVITP